MIFYELTSEDLSKLGGPMGTETTSVIFTRAFDSEQKAKDAAEKDHKKYKSDQVIKWTQQRDGSLYSGDLLSHDYTIREKKIE